MRVYWANAFFGEADRAYNAVAAGRLRAAGFEVISPQELAINTAGSQPGATDVFRVDTALLLASDAVVACVDQESIDAGVACEAGVAYSFGIPLIGLYTDFRQDRSDAGRMYKNLYVLGCLGQATCRTLSEVIDRLNAVTTAARPPAPAPEEHFSLHADRYSDFILKRLASWYVPAWSPIDRLRTLYFQSNVERILDLGCGPGTWISGLLQAIPSAGSYVGFDISHQAIEEAVRNTSHVPAARFTPAWPDILERSRSEPFDLALSLFCLHDVADRTGTLKRWSEALADHSQLVIMDLASDDLPAVTSRLRRGLALPAIPHSDHRFRLVDLLDAATHADLSPVSWNVDAPRIRFPTAESLDEYLDTFGIYAGMDLPLDLRPDEADHNRSKIADILATWHWPFEDRRVFVTCVLQRRPRTS